MPARFADLRRALREFGVRAEPHTRGSHWKLISANGRTYILTAHNGDRSEISDVYLRALCRNLGIDLAELKRRL